MALVLSVDGDWKVYLESLAMKMVSQRWEPQHTLLQVSWLYRLPGLGCPASESLCWPPQSPQKGRRYLSHSLFSRHFHGCSPSIGWPSLLFHSLSCNCSFLCLKKPTTRKRGRLQEHSRYKMIQRSLRGPECDWRACSVNTSGNTRQMVPVLIFPGTQTLCLSIPAGLIAPKSVISALLGEQIHRNLFPSGRWHLPTVFCIRGCVLAKVLDWPELEL